MSAGGGHSAAAATFRARYGDWAVVTGASDGIGREFARALAGRGLHLILVARRAAELDKLAVELRARHAIECAVVTADLACPEGTDMVIKAAERRQVGLLVAAAGFGTSGEFVLNRLEDELGMLDVNCRSVVALAHHFGERFAYQRRGGLVLLSSVLAFQGVPRAANYAATKAFVQTLAEGLALELKPRGVAVIAAAPGPVASGFAARARMRMSLALPPASVADTTLCALGSWTTVRPGWLSKLLGWSLATLPRAARTRVLREVMRGMTSGQSAEVRSAD